MAFDSIKGGGHRQSAFFQRLDHWIDQERDQLALWLPVGLGTGVGAWFLIPTREGWIALIMAAAAMAGLMAVLLGGRPGRAGASFLFAVALGGALVWWRADHVATPRLERPQVSYFTARIDAVELLTARDSIRLLLSPDPGQHLPSRLRLNVDNQFVSKGLEPGARISLRARLMPPPTAALPGAYDYARVAWFRGIGATGRALAPLAVVAQAQPNGFNDWIAGVRAHLTAHINHMLAGSKGGIAAAFVTGDQGAITEEDAKAMRTSGLAHLLSISGLHVAVVVGGTMLLVMRLLALSERLALRLPLPLIAAGAAALAGIAYTLIAGAEVPTIRSCIAAVLILIALALGREAMTLRLVATGAVIVLLAWPEAIVGPSFQLSFAAVATLVSFHEYPRIRDWFKKRDEGLPTRIIRNAMSLLLTGLIIELALMPIALFHFHRTGIYGAVANIIAIPLTSFVIMPLEGLALLLDAVGLGRPMWWLAGWSLRLLIALAHHVSSLPGSVAALPAMPVGAFMFVVAGGLWLCLWRTRARLYGVPLIAVGALWSFMMPVPDLLITGDGRNLAVREGDSMALLRPRTGDYVRNLIGEMAADDADQALELLPIARCNGDLCIADLPGKGRRWRLVATRSPYLVRWSEMIRLCGEADIVVSDRRLPARCHPRWLKADRPFLQQTGGLAISFSPLTVRMTRQRIDDHPWMVINPASYRP